MLRCGIHSRRRERGGGAILERRCRRGGGIDVRIGNGAKGACGIKEQMSDR